MSLPIISSILTTVLFGIVALILSMREDKVKALLIERDTKQKQRLYEITVLREIQDKIGYALDVEKVVSVITGSVNNLFPTLLPLLWLSQMENSVLKTHIEEQVTKKYLEELKKKMIKSLSSLTTATIPDSVEEKISGVVLENAPTVLPASYVHIPLTVNDVVVGIITIASTKPNVYKEDEVTILYRIVTQATTALTRLQEVLDTEKGKLLAMIRSLVDGVFMVDNNNNLLVINDTAKKFLALSKEPTVSQIDKALGNSYNLDQKLEEAIKLNKSNDAQEIKLADRTVQVFITPVHKEKGSGDQPTVVIGAAVLLHDITLEKSLAQMKEDFTNMVVHDLRAPLAAMKSASELMITSGSLKPEDQKKATWHY
jgi:K+-sensing histidine kinase KdpD